MKKATIILNDRHDCDHTQHRLAGAPYTLNEYHGEGDNPPPPTWYQDIWVEEEE